MDGRRDKRKIVGRVAERKGRIGNIKEKDREGRKVKNERGRVGRRQEENKKERGSNEEKGVAKKKSELKYEYFIFVFVRRNVVKNQ